MNIYENIKQRKKNCRKIKMGISAKLPISHLLIVIPDTNKLGSKYMLRHSTFYAMIGYANHFMIIFLNINLNFRKERKMVIKLRGCTKTITHIVAAYIPTLPNLVPT